MRYPKGEELDLGYEDNMVNTSEYFHLWVIETDYDIESLIARIAELEKRIENGVTVRAEIPSAPVVEKETPSAPIAQEEEYIPPVEDVPPEEGFTVSEYFDEPKKPAPAPVKPPREMKPAAKGDSKATFGSFLRSIRKIARNGVLLTLCMDLDGGYDGGVFVLYTESETIFRSLKKEEHYALIAQAFEGIGIGAEEFELRLRGKQSDEFNKRVQELKDTFDGVKIEIK